MICGIDTIAKDQDSTGISTQFIVLVFVILSKISYDEQNYSGTLPFKGVDIDGHRYSYRNGHCTWRSRYD